ncbi:MAG: pirin family protein [Ilumatobacteraceae bacterium]
MTDHTAPTTSSSTITIQRADERFVTNIGWLDSKHSFNFGEHWSPEHTGHGLLLVNNDDIVAPAQGFGTHGHRNMEIVTWVLSGTLEHRDSEGNHGTLYPGLAQRMSAGRGIRHSEMNPSPETPVHFVQMWVLPDTDEIDPGYEQRDVNDALGRGGLVPIASGKGHPDAITIHQRGAVLWGARLRQGEAIEVPRGGHVHVFVALGSGTLASAGALSAGDAVRLTNADAGTFTADEDGTELLIWETS